jgi:carbon storage regulator
MLVLSRKLGESLNIDGHIKVTVLETRGRKVRLGIEAPAHVSIVRSEINDWSALSFESVQAVEGETIEASA